MQNHITVVLVPLPAAAIDGKVTKAFDGWPYFSDQLQSHCATDELQCCQASLQSIQAQSQAPPTSVFTTQAT